MFSYIIWVNFSVKNFSFYMCKMETRVSGILVRVNEISYKAGQYSTLNILSTIMCGSLYADNCNNNYEKSTQIFALLGWGEHAIASVAVQWVQIRTAHKGNLEGDSFLQTLLQCILTYSIVPLHDMFCHDSTMK